MDRHWIEFCCDPVPLLHSRELAGANCEAMPGLRCGIPDHFFGADAILPTPARDADGLYK
jgi:hypothetical protein